MTEPPSEPGFVEITITPDASRFIANLRRACRSINEIAAKWPGGLAALTRYLAREWSAERRAYAIRSGEIVCGFRHELLTPGDACPQCRAAL